tara:strand:- start:322 stop:576 length:255 start_codon:yes stop_codon:yes gene_type:complete
MTLNFRLLLGTITATIFALPLQAASFKQVKSLFESNVQINHVDSLAKLNGIVYAEYAPELNVVTDQSQFTAATMASCLYWCSIT